jgi:hypothetical protein
MFGPGLNPNYILGCSFYHQIPAPASEAENTEEGKVKPPGTCHTARAITGPKAEEQDVRA